ncbi:MAG: hypothetical protein M3495_21990 [Pseudomonadota bacterium]|nr:hypothetical protein [Pseudomonadota bacterium]
MTVRDYEAIGGLAAALSNHGDEVLAELPPERQRIAEIMFRRLSGSENGRRDVRAPARVEEVAKLAAAEVGEVIAVAEAFRRPDRGFLAASEGPLRADTMLDVSHECLIRQWQRLAGWVAAEANSEEMYRRLRDWALRWEQGNAELWRGPDLASALAWRQKEKPSPEWTERYGGGDRFHRAMKFLDASEEAQCAAAAAAEARRQAQLRRIRRLSWGFGGATLGLAAAILLYLVLDRWDSNAYYEEYVEVRGVPRGIGPLTAAEVGHHAASYKITKRGRLGPVTSMQLVNAAGQPRNLKGTLLGMSSDEITKTVSRWEYLYDAQDQIAYKISLDRDGQRLQSIIYAPSEPEPIRSRTAYAIGKDGSLAPQKGSCAAFLTYDYSPEGYVGRVHYLDQAGNPTPGKDDAFIKQSKYDRQGRVIESTSLWKDGRPMNDNGGNAGTRSSYDDSGNLVAFEYVDAAGKPIDLKKSGFQRFTCRYDDRGNCVEPAIWHADGSLIYLSEMESIFCHSLRRRYDDRGNMVGGDCLTANGQPAMSGRTKYDEHDRPIEDTYFGRTGHPAVGPFGGFRMTLTHDAGGNVTEMAFFDENGKAMSGNQGFHRALHKFESGREVRVEYRDGDGKLVAIDGGYAAIERTFDAQGNEVRTAYFGLDDRPAPNRNEGFAVKRTVFDACRRETEKRFLDENEHPVRGKNGYAQIRQAYDESNNVKEETYLDENGQPIRSVDGYAHITREFDHNRNIIDERHLDEQDKALLLKGAYAEHQSRYDDHNALVEEAFLGASGEPVLNEKGWAKHARRYDEHNALVEEAYFGASGQPVLNDGGWARMTNVNDAHGREIERTYFGTDGKPVNMKEGYAKRTWHYDPHGAVVEMAYFGASGEPVLMDEGFARVKNVNDELGRTIEQAYFGVRGEPVIGTKGYHRGKYVLDERGNQLESATFGVDGKALSTKEGYAKVIKRYNARKAVVEEAFFGTGGEPVLNEDGYARASYRMNDRGQAIEKAYFGTDGQPIQQKHGYAKIVSRYDDYGSWFEQAFFGIDGERVLSDGRFARISIIIDKLGRLVEWAYFGVRGEPVIGPEDRPCHRVRRIPDERDNELELATFGTDGKPLEVADSASGRRCARLVRHFDATNKEIDSECFNARGNRVPNKKDRVGNAATGVEAREAEPGREHHPGDQQAAFGGQHRAEGRRSDAHHRRLAPAALAS